ncbi:mechanosensitive ion channel family protein [Noviherbaspirillum massiliense]|uniref:mechanosensitive ion channel family protein n=1 Tax=Noviherbaspirillum massiliense TaxID=1465823 RepID=UPI0002EF4AFB|nr:mechanosensitive ion channel family protein [Noviherbaspirillum massiliense]
MNLREFEQWIYEARPLLHIALIWLLAAVLLRFIHRLLRLLQGHIAQRTAGQADHKRTETLISVFRYAANVVIIALVAMLTLAEIGISITPILATAGVAGIAIGFGAQSLVKDFFNGLFLLIENQINEGDSIDAAGKAGIVERVTLRHIRIRDYDGSVHFIPNGMITLVTNRSREFSYAVIDVSLPRQSNLDQAFGLLQKVGDEMRKDPALGALIVADLEISGLEKVEEATVVARCRIKVLPAKQWRVRREFLLRMKRELDAVEAKPPAD